MYILKLETDEAQVIAIHVVFSDILESMATHDLVAAAKTLADMSHLSHAQALAVAYDYSSKSEHYKGDEDGLAYIARAVGMITRNGQEYVRVVIVKQGERNATQSDVTA